MRARKAKKAAAPKPAAPASTLATDAEAICKLIDHAKRQGVAFFKGPQGIEFAFRRETKPGGTQRPIEVGDEFIP